jgi:hypothetical protein
LSNQFPRKIGLVVSSSGGQGLDLSLLRIVFHVHAPDVDMPPTATITVYNLSEATAQQVQNEFQQVTLQAGYESGNYGVIFQGSIIRVRKGRESNIDSFVEIMASDLDAWFNYGVANKTLETGQSSPQAIIQANIDSSNDYISKLNLNPAPAAVTIGFIDPSLGTGGTLPRGKVLFGLARERMTDVVQGRSISWFISHGQLQYVALNNYAPGEAVQINAMTGMIGVPEATVNGIEVTCLLNPKIKTGTRIQLNNGDITNTRVQNAQVGGQEVPVGFPNIQGLEFFASLSADGFYKVIVAEHEGDSRGQPWYSKLICLNVDSSASAGPVNAFGTQGTKGTL